MKKKLVAILLFSILTYLFTVGISHASFLEQLKVEVAPKVLDIEAHPHEFFEYKISLFNVGKFKANLYPIVNLLSTEGNFLKEESFSKDNLKWIKIPRSRISLWPGEKTEIPLKIEIPPQMKLGVYHVSIVFSYGSSFPEAKENAAKFNQPKVLINLALTRENIEKLEIVRFFSLKKIYFSAPAKLEAELRNIGNVEIPYRSTLLVYDRNGKEISSFNLTKKGSIKENSSKKLIYLLKGLISKPGYYKARLVVDYGNNFSQEVSDNYYFWIFPYKTILFILAFLVGGLIIVFALLIGKINKNVSYFHNFSKKGKSEVIDLRDNEKKKF